MEDSKPSNSTEQTVNELKDGLKQGREFDPLSKVNKLMSSIYKSLSRVTSLLEVGLSKARGKLKNAGEYIDKELATSKTVDSLKKTYSKKAAKAKEYLNKTFTKVTDVLTRERKAEVDSGELSTPPPTYKDSESSTTETKQKSKLYTKIDSLVESVQTLKSISQNTVRQLIDKQSKQSEQTEEPSKQPKGDKSVPSEELSKDSKKPLLSRLKDRIDSIHDKLVEKADKLQGKKPSKRKETDSKKDSRGIWSKLQERIDRRKKEVEEEKARVKGKESEKDDKSDKGWVGKIIGAISSGIGFLISSVKNITGGLLGGVGKILIGTAIPFLIKKMGSLFGRLIPILSSSIAKTTGSLLFRLIKVISKGGLKLGKAAVITAGKATLALGKRAAITLAPHVLRAGAFLLTPAGLAIGGTAVAAYGAYRLVKYFTRNNIPSTLAGRSTYLRLLMYGFDINRKEHFHKVFQLEEAMNDYIKATKGSTSVKPIDDDLRKKIFDIFGVGDDNPDLKTTLNNWFINRFLPVYRISVGALSLTRDDASLSDLEKLSKGQIETLVARSIPPSSIYKITQLPIPGDNTTEVTSDDVEQYRQSIINEIKTGKKQPVVPREVKESKSNTPSSVKDLTTQRSPIGPEPTQSKPTQVSPPSSSSVQTPPVSKESVTTSPVQTNTITSKVERQSKPVANIVNAIEQKQPDVNKKIEEFPKNYRKETVTVVKNPYLPKTQPIPEELKPDSRPPNIQKNIQINKSKNIPLDSVQLNKPVNSLYAIQPEMFDLLMAMATEYKEKTGKKLVINSAYRSKEEQARIYASTSAKGRAAPPGRSLHEFGLAVDLNSADANQLESLALLKKYGFTRPVGNEKWHVENIGISLDPNRSKVDENFRKTMILASPGKGGGGYGTVSTRYGRNIALQKQIFNSSPTDVSVYKEATEKLASKTGDELEVESKPFVASVEKSTSDLTKPNITGDNKPLQKVALAVNTATGTQSVASIPITNQSSVSTPSSTQSTTASTPSVTTQSLVPSGAPNKSSEGFVKTSFSLTETSENNVSKQPVRGLDNDINKLPKSLLTIPTVQSTPVKQPDVVKTTPIDTGPIENILSDQLVTLKQILNVIGIINNKFDMDKLKSMMPTPGPTPVTYRQPVDNRSNEPFQQDNSLNLRRKLSV